ncbi:hypothetical protein RHMOL_Rhmol07G0050000 [Rhododendron molle]|uniref:Uncharacterized protein n=1 Tax=Rhododendron molle TaxID=49168 RepID=A0ACC0MXF2_RHOML|nr:hypothetical protein RHMOL_Rhmol07G0050000 [Rhododendron molle]
MACLKLAINDMKKIKEEETSLLDGTVDQHGRPAIRRTTGNMVCWNSNTRVMGQDNAEAANSVSKWTGTVYIFSLLGAFLSDSYWGRYKTCAIFQAIFVLKPFWAILRTKGMRTQGFWASAGSATLALVLFLMGTPRYRHFTPRGNPLSRFCQVVVAAARKWKVPESGKECSNNGSRKILHTHGFKFLDRAAIIPSKEYTTQAKECHNPWRICPVTQVEEVKCILRLLPIWLCTILYSVVFTQMDSLFVEQGAAMKTTISSFHIPPASMSSFDILSVATFIFVYRQVQGFR